VPPPPRLQWADGSAYVNHVELVRRARGAEMPASFWTDPLITRAAPTRSSGPATRSPWRRAWGIDFEAEWPWSPGDVSTGALHEEGWGGDPARGVGQRRFLRQPDPASSPKGFGFFQSKPSSPCRRVGRHPDELGEAWDGGHAGGCAPLLRKPATLRRPKRRGDMTFDFPTLISHAAIDAIPRSRDESSVPGRCRQEARTADRATVRGGSLGYSLHRRDAHGGDILGGPPRRPFLNSGTRSGSIIGRRSEGTRSRGDRAGGGATWILAVISAEPKRERARSHSGRNCGLGRGTNAPGVLVSRLRSPEMTVVPHVHSR
jgi:fumarylacetoacetate (FAA) hydrolase